MKNIVKEDLNHMKYLKINDNKGYFLQQAEPEEIWVEIDKISKEDLMFLLNKATKDDFSMDEYSEESLSHRAHQIVYKNIHEKFAHLIENKNIFRDECDNQFIEALDKYQEEE